MKLLITKEYLYNYFDGKANHLQKQYIDEWIKEPKNKEFFYECLATWEKEHLQYWAPAEQGYQRHLARMKQFKVDENEEKPLPPVQLKKSFPFMIAASVALLCMLGLGLFYKKEELFYKHYTTVYGETQHVVLEDGSEVFLNANSSLKVPRFGFNNYARSVFLVGEASFSIKHLPNNQNFIVNTANQFKVEVLGTEFSVFSRQRGGKVILAKGKVQFHGQDTQITMKPGDLISIDKNGESVLLKNKNLATFSSWKEHRFVFDQTTMQELVYIFQESFGVEVVLPDTKMESWTVSGSFPAKTADELLETISVAANFTYKKEGNKVFIQL